MDITINISEFEPPEIIQTLYSILSKGLSENKFHDCTLTFRCNQCEDVIEFRFVNIRCIDFEEKYMKVEFDDIGVWLTPYNNIVDFWIERCIIDDGQKTLFEV